MDKQAIIKALRDTAQSASNAIASNVSGPVDLLAAGLRMGGLNVNNPMGGSQWMQERGLTREVEMGAPRIVGETLGMAGPALATQFAPKIAGALNQGGANLASPRTMNPQTGAIVWHGSPHKFDKFDSGKIGTGEGAQAYGHGLYLAESPDVATMYKEALSRYDVPDTGPVQFAHNILQSNKYAPRTEEMLRKSHPQLNDSEIFQTIQQAKDAIAKGKTGSLYKVDLPDEHIAKMLDWDKPLHRQAPAIRKALRGVVDDNLGQGAYSGVIRSRPDFKNLQNDILENLDQSQIAEQLRNKGLTGIRYLDGGSRGAGQGSSNFVVFPGNESMLKILERNGQAPGMMGIK